MSQGLCFQSEIASLRCAQGRNESVHEGFSASCQQFSVVLDGQIDRAAFMKLANKVCVIAGGSGAIGSAVARRFYA